MADTYDMHHMPGRPGTELLLHGIGAWKIEERHMGHWLHVVIPFPQGAEQASGSAPLPGAIHRDRVIIDVAINSAELPSEWKNKFPDSVWEFDDNMDAPTLQPSIWHNKPSGWHGHVRNGQLVEA